MEKIVIVVKNYNESDFKCKSVSLENGNRIGSIQPSKLIKEINLMYN